MKITFFIIAFICHTLCFSQTQIGQDIDGAAPRNNFGESVSLSSNGFILAIGGFTNSSNSGHVQVYQNVYGNWVQLGEDIHGDVDEMLGYSVSLNANGDILAVGSLSGFVKIYQNQHDNWVQIGSTLLGGSINDSQNTVSLNSEGNILAIGIPKNTNTNGLFAGSVRVYENINNNWIQIGSNIDGGEANYDNFGSSVHLSDDGSILAVGAIQNVGPVENIDPGFVKIFKNQGNNWVQLGANIVGEAPGDRCGYSLDLNSNGTTVAVGSPGASHVRVFENQSNTWLQVGTTIIDESENDSAGHTISLNDNGTILAIGAPVNGDTASDKGQTRVFEYQNGNWTQVGEDIDGEGASDNFGRSVSLNADGLVLAVGAPSNDGVNGTDSGHVRVYNLDPNLVIPIFDPVVAICKGETLNPLPTTSNNGITGTWSPPIDNTQTTTYVFIPDTGQSSTATSLTIKVNELNEVEPEFDAMLSICAGEALNPLPTTSNNGITGTWFPPLDNTQTTTYTFTPNLEECRTLTTTLTIEVHEVLTPEFNAIAPICKDALLHSLPTTSNNGIKGTWSPALNNTQTTIYTFTPNSNECSTTTQLEIIVNDLEVTLEVLSAPFSDYGIIKANASGGSGNYEYQLDNGFWVMSNVFNNLNDCDQHTISVRDINGCNTEVTATIQLLTYPKFFTPNGDGVNERWNIECLSYQQFAKISIFDRYGKLLSKISPNGMGWDGTYNGKVLPSNDYWFVVEYLDELNNKKTFKSHFTLKR